VEKGCEGSWKSLSALYWYLKELSFDSNACGGSGYIVGVGEERVVLNLKRKGCLYYSVGCQEHSTRNVFIKLEANKHITIVKVNFTHETFICA
jgi:hypothetical protein